MDESRDVDFIRCDWTGASHTALLMHLSNPYSLGDFAYAHVTTTELTSGINDRCVDFVSTHRSQGAVLKDLNQPLIVELSSGNSFSSVDTKRKKSEDLMHMRLD